MELIGLQLTRHMRITRQECYWTDEISITDYGREVALARSETCIIVEQPNRGTERAHIFQVILLTKLIQYLQKIQMESIASSNCFSRMVG